MFAATQTEFLRALLDPEHPIPDAVTAHTARRPERRFAVYRNNVVVGLVNALRAKFPATERIVGEEFFAAMAQGFVFAHPPRSKILHAYGDDFGDFIQNFAPAGDLRYLPDVARLEAARTRAYHAADAAPLGLSAFAAIAPEAIGSACLALHPSLSIIRSRHPVVTIWAMNAGEVELAPVDENATEDALILRPNMQVIVRKLPSCGADLLQALASGAMLAAAASVAAGRDQRFDLTENLAGLIESGAVTACTIAQGQTP